MDGMNPAPPMAVLTSAAPLAETSPTPPGAGTSPANSEPQGGAATAVREQARPARGKVEHLPPWRVLLHNADDPTMDDVVSALVELTPLDATRAFTVMMEAHKTGVALVLVTHRERAELYRDQFRSKRLTVTIEAAD